MHSQSSPMELSALNLAGTLQQFYAHKMNKTYIRQSGNPQLEGQGLTDENQAAKSLLHFLLLPPLSPYLLCRSRRQRIICSPILQSAEVVKIMPPLIIKIHRHETNPEDRMKYLRMHSNPGTFPCPIISAAKISCVLGSVKVKATLKTWSQFLVTSRPHYQILKNCHFTVNLKDFCCYSVFPLVDFSYMIKFTEYLMIFCIIW